MIIQVQLTTQENADFFKLPINSIKDIDFEEYIMGCVAGEIGNSSIEVCRAQAIACRTYAYRVIPMNNVISDSSSHAQAYRAPRAYNNSYSNAQRGTKDTTGLLLFYNNKIISPAAFTASNGGQTVSSESAWGGKREYLIEQKDEWDIAEGKTNRSGHGVGLSQRGAKYAASIGKTYREILSFYYPGTIIVTNYGKEDGASMTEKEKIICEWALAQKGHPYIYGATEKACTPAYRRARMAQYPEYASAMIRNCQVLKNGKSICNGCKWYDNINNKSLTAFDCAQLTRKAMSQIGISFPSGASSQWKGNYWAEKGTIDTLPVDKVCILYRATSSTIMGHTGLYLGPYKITIDAHGHDYGVIESTVEKYGKWTHWGIPKGFYTDNDVQVTPIDLSKEEIIKMLYQVKVISNGTLRLRKIANNTGTILTTIPTGTVLDVLEETSADWLKVTYKTYIGYVSKVFTQKIEEKATSTDQTYYLKIKATSQNDAQAMLELLKRIADGSVVSS